MNRSNFKVLVPYMASAAMVFLFFSDVLFHGKTFYFRDIHRWFYPMKFFLSAAYDKGQLPFWCSSYFCGSPFLSDIQSGFFYPLSLVFALFSFPFSFNLFICAHFFLGFIFCHHFLISTGRSQKAALFAATSFCYGGYLIASVNTLNNLTTAIWMPAILWRYQLIQNGHGSLKNHLMVVFCLAAAILGGEPQLVIMMTALWIAWAWVSGHKLRLKERIRQQFKISLLILAATLLTLVQLGPTFLDYQQSTRLGGIPFHLAAQHSMGLESLKHLFWPLRFPPDFETSLKTLGYFFPEKGPLPWLLTVYPGFLVLPFSIVSLRKSLHFDNWFWVGIFSFSLILTLGSHTPIYFLFYKILPFFRFPEKFMFLAGFCLVVLAAGGLDRILRAMDGSKVSPALLFALLWIVLFSDLFWANRHLNPVCEPNFYHAHHRQLAPIFNDTGKFRVYIDPDVTSPDSGHNRVVNYHARWQLVQMPHLGIISGIDHIDGNTGMELQYQYMIYKVLTLPWEKKIGFLRLANVKYIVSSSPLETVEILKGRVEKLTPILYRLKDSLPRSFLIGDTLPSANFSVLELAAESFDPQKIALAEGDIPRRFQTGFYQNVDAIHYTGSGKIEVNVKAKKPSLLVLSESHYPGWQVRVDGLLKKNLRLNIFFQGVELEKGRHSVEFFYKPPYFDVFSAVSLATLAVLGLLCLRRSPSGDHMKNSRTPS